MRSRPILLAVLAAGVLPAAGCGDQRPPVATGPVAPSAKTVEYEFPRAGMTLRLPANLQVERLARLPAVFRAGLVEPFVSAFAYRRAEQVPRNARELAAA
ncbi:MAG TPA: hypothetical protein VFY44_08405, partial [Thermoleophilaceae bacterium]|nr:hypothetical protein [Thermoleophilaceae bacterium]